VIRASLRAPRYEAIPWPCRKMRRTLHVARCRAASPIILTAYDPADGRRLLPPEPSTAAAATAEGRGTAVRGSPRSRSLPLRVARPRRQRHLKRSFGRTRSSSTVVTDWIPRFCRCSADTAAKGGGRKACPLGVECSSRKMWPRQCCPRTPDAATGRWPNRPRNDPSTPRQTIRSRSDLHRRTSSAECPVVPRLTRWSYASAVNDVIGGRACVICMESSGMPKWPRHQWSER